MKTEAHLFMSRESREDQTKRSETEMDVKYIEQETTDYERMQQFVEQVEIEKSGLEQALYESKCNEANSLAQLKSYIKENQALKQDYEQQKQYI